MKNNIKGIFYCNTKKKYIIRYIKYGINYYVGSSNNINIANSMLNKHKKIMRKIKREEGKKELKRIVEYVNNIYGGDITKKTRKNHIALYRALATKIAFKVTPYSSFTDIGEVLNVDHSTISFYKRVLIKEISVLSDFVKYYNNYYLVNAKEQKMPLSEFNNLKKMLNNLRIEHEKLIKINSNNELTDNEKKYRLLTEEQQKTYNERTSLILKSFEWQKPKNDFEIINCSM